MDDFFEDIAIATEKKRLEHEANGDILPVPTKPKKRKLVEKASVISLVYCFHIHHVVFQNFDFYSVDCVNISSLLQYNLHSPLHVIVNR
jgi:hypothetical protein